MDKLHCAFKIRFAKDDIFFGVGVITLLKLTEQFESLNAAAKNMNLSYSKATKMISNTEKALGFKLLDRKIGGTNGGGSKLTAECKEFIEVYEVFFNETNKNTEKLFNELFSKYI